MRTTRPYSIAVLVGMAILSCSSLSLAAANAGFTIEQALSAPFTSLLTAAPAKGRVAWVANVEGKRNLWIADATTGPDSSRQLTQFDADDGQDIGDLAWSPDAESIAYVHGGDFEAVSKSAPNPALLTAGVEQDVWVVNIGTGKQTKIGAGHSPLFAASGNAVVYILNSQVWTAKLDGKTKPEQLIHTRGDIQSLRLSPDEKLLAFVSQRGNYSFIGVYNFSAKTLTYLGPSTDSDSEPVWSPDSHNIAFLRIPGGGPEYEFAPHRTSPLPWSIRVGDPLTGTSREIWEASEGRGSVFREDVADNQLLWAADDHIVFPWELDGWLHLYSVPVRAVAHNSATPLTPGSFDVEHVSISKDRATIVYSSNQDDTDRRHIWKLALNTEAAAANPAPLTSGEGIEVFPIVASDNHTVAVLRSDTRIPIRAAVLGKGGQLEDLAPKAIPADFPGHMFVTPQQVIFSAADGMQIHGQLFLPATPAPGLRPALVFFHGGSRRQMLLGFHYMDYYSNAYAMNQFLASQGYIVLAVNYRSGIGYGSDFREALNYGAAGASEFNDVLGAGLYLRGRPDIDPARIGAWGGSYGGYLTALALARSSDVFAAGVDFHGVHDWNIELANWNTAYDPKADPNSTRVAYESSPIASLQTWRSPVLLIHGDDDRNVQFSQTPVLAAALKKQHVPVEDLIFPDEIHVFLLHRHWIAAYTAEADFFARRLAHFRSPAPSSP
jgi:dipeptidyl aminopeptidase/acylaminoacyl peptidase